MENKRDAKAEDKLSSFPVMPPKTFFQPFDKLNEIDTFAGFDLRSMPQYDDYGYLSSPTGEKLFSQRWSMRDYGDPNINDLVLGISWFRSETEASQYYSVITERVSKLAARAPAGPQLKDRIEMAFADEARFSALEIPGGAESILQIAARYGNYVFNLVVMVKPDGYFKNIDSFTEYARAFDLHVRRILTGA